MVLPLGLIQQVCARSRPPFQETLSRLVPRDLHHVNRRKAPRWRISYTFGGLHQYVLVPFVSAVDTDGPDDLLVLKSLHVIGWVHHGISAGDVMVEILTGEVKLVDVEYAKEAGCPNPKRRQHGKPFSESITAALLMMVGFCSEARTRRRQYHDRMIL